MTDWTICSPDKVKVLQGGAGPRLWHVRSPMDMTLVIGLLSARFLPALISILIIHVALMSGVYF